MINSEEPLLREQIVDDLNSRIFYKISFSIEEKPSSRGMDLLWELVLQIKRWLERKERRDGRVHVPSEIKRWTSFKNGGKIYDAKRSKGFFAESIKRVNPQNENDVSWSCRIRECQNEIGFAPRWWNTEIGFQTMNNGAARLTFVVSYGDAMGFIGECLPIPEMSIPWIVRSIQGDDRFNCLVNDEPLLFETLQLKAGDGIVLREQIYDKKRGIPLILITPKKDYNNSDLVKLPIDPKKMIQSVAGNALVYYSNDIEFVEEFKYVMEGNYKCTAGMIRYYLPNIDTSNPLDANRHRFIHYDEAIKMGEETILKIFRRVVSQDINDYDKLFGFRECQELLRRDALQERFNLLKQKQDENSQLLSNVEDDYSQKLERLELEKLAVKMENENLKSELNQGKKENYKLKSQLDNMRAIYIPLQAKKEAYDSLREMDTYPNTQREVLDYFSTVFSDRIAVTSRGWETIDECKTSLDILWKALYSMVTTLYDSLENASSFNEACMKYNEIENFTCAGGESGTTKKDKKISREHKDYYNDTLINIEPHIKTNVGSESDPRFLRIYFCNYCDEKTGMRKIVIGSCGNHLTTAGTKKRK